MTEPRELVEQVIPFQFLPRARLDALASRLEQRRYRDGEILLEAGDRSRELLVLASGRIEAVNAQGHVASTVTEGHYFAEQAALFDRPHSMSLRARGEVVVYALAAADLLPLVRDEPSFAHAFGSALRDKHGIFTNYRHLFARIRALLDSRAFLLSDLVEAYRKLKPAMHPLLDDDAIDVGALGYAVARLPASVTQTTFYYLCSALPELYSDPESKFDAVSTRARRRFSWEPMPGKLIVLLRDGITDVTDLLSCLCLYSVEARKIRHRLRSSGNLKALKAIVEKPDTDAERTLIDGLALSDNERQGLRRIWPDNCAAQIRNILLHHEDIGVECDLVARDYNLSASDRWVSEIQRCAAQLVDLDSDELEVHIISSNTHSVANCLSPYLGKRAEEIARWGREHRPELCDGSWPNQRDLLYVLAREYESEMPGARQERTAEERACGHFRLSHTAFTGISVDLIDCRRIDASMADPAVRARRCERPKLIVNVDYAFGQQAEEILANLLYLFGKRVRSVNVLGKAGGLVGERGDLLIPSSTLLQTNDEIYPLPGRDLPVELLSELVPGRAVHEGPVLTVAGTLLQDPVLLSFYRRIWRCVGLEMEGSFFARQLHTAIQTGVARSDVKVRFAYYISDLPAVADGNLSEPLAPWEGVPPLYGITRAILRRIFASE
jgi:CRP-like cAMP-binding protein